ncbi:energy-coupled thiamine transporter ThiT [uncultured Anaerococcus sp.]|uniref:energy-coupled thiamine transporter ThiT n=1 Tax=uncultured Anaerococcus sp. TaxID=293428 RepID=UPI00260D031D|nr:energy-coupled thiamine transporter ThiT [uncultured Anaerococcus sp.]
MNNNSKWSTKMIAEGGVMLALAFILGRITLFKMPQGGSITAGQMIPLVIFAIRHGAGPGIVVGALYGILDMIFGGSIYHPVQAILDYPLAYASLGLVGLFSKDFMENQKIAPVIKGTLLGVFARFICHVLTGVIFFGSYAPEGQNVWAYSIIYNGTFLGVEFVITIIIIYLLKNFITKDIAKL